VASIRLGLFHDNAVVYKYGARCRVICEGPLIGAWAGWIGSAQTGLDPIRGLPGVAATATVPPYIQTAQNHCRASMKAAIRCG